MKKITNINSYNIINCKKKIKFLFTLFFICIFSFAHAIKIIEITDNISSYPIIDSVEIYIDKEGVATENNITSLQFTPLNNRTISVGLGVKYVWIKCGIKNIGTNSRHLILDIDNPDLNQVTFYEFRNNTLLNIYETGELNANKAPKAYYRSYFYEIDLRPGDESHIYVKIGNSKDAIVAPLSLISQKEFAYNDYISSVIHFFIYGILFSLIIIALILFIKIKQRLYIYATAYLTFGLLLISTTYGFTTQIFFENSSQCVYYFRIILIYMAAISGITFGYEFLQIKKIKPYTTKLVIIIDIVGVFLAFTSLLPEPLSFFSYRMWPIYIISYLCLMGYWSVVVYKTNKLPATIISASFLPITISVFLLFLRNYGFIQTKSVLIGFQYVLPLQMAILAYGLIENLRISQNNLITSLRNKNKIIENQSDILKQKNNELEILKIASSNAINGIVIFNKQGTILWINKFFKLNFMPPNSVLKSDKDTNVFQYLNHSIFKEKYEESIKENISKIFEITKNNGDNKNKEFQISITPILNKRNEIENFVSIQSDITKVKEAGREKETLQNKISQMERLESIGKLAGGIAHDFNNLLTPIIGYADMILLEDNLPSNTKEDVESICISAQRAKKLVNQILTFSNYFKPSITIVSVDKIINEAIKILTKNHKDIIFNYSKYSDFAYVKADETHIHQIIMNICKNSIQAIGKNKGVIDIALNLVNISTVDLSKSSISTEGNGYFVEIIISDNGAGMDEETQKKIFEPFFSTKHLSEGTGLGMAVVYSIINQYNGAIDIFSKKMQGTSIKIYLPLAKEEIDIKQNSPTYNESSMSVNSQKILLVDDEEAITKLYIRILTSRGWQVVAFNNSTSALEYYKSNPNVWSLVITDQTMPELQGDELSKEILRINPEQKIILITGYSEIINKEIALKIGISSFVLKPITPSELLRHCESLITENH